MAFFDKCLLKHYIDPVRPLPGINKYKNVTWELQDLRYILLQRDIFRYRSAKSKVIRSLFKSSKTALRRLSNFEGQQRGATISNHKVSEVRLSSFPLP